MHVNCPVRQLFYVGALPVPLQTLRQQRVEHTLYRGEGHGSDPVEDWDRKLAADWLDSLLTILGRPVVAGDQGRDILAPDVLWERLGRGHRLQAQESAKLQARTRTCSGACAAAGATSASCRASCLGHTRYPWYLPARW